MNFSKYKKDIEFAIKNKYKIEVHYTDDIDYVNNNINWKYPPYQIKNFLIEKIVLEIENYFKNSNDHLIVMYFEGNNVIHKIPLNLPKNFKKN